VAALEVLEAAVADADAEAEGIEAAIAALRERRDAAAAEQAALLDPARDGGLARALDALAAAARARDIGDLVAAACETPGTEDDRLVRDLDRIAAALGSVAAEEAALRDRLDETRRRRRELEESARRARRGGYAGRRGEVGDAEALGRVLGGVLEWAIRSGALGKVLSEGLRPRARRSRAGFGGGFRLPGRIGGGEGGGGFRTGGGF
jgi:chromosome segregation ATPase